MATKLKVITDAADIVPAPTLTGVVETTVGQFTTAPTRKRHAGWTAERQRRFIEHLALTGHLVRSSVDPRARRAEARHALRGASS